MESNLWQKDCWQGEGGRPRGMFPTSDGGWVLEGGKGRIRETASPGTSQQEGHVRARHDPLHQPQKLGPTSSTGNTGSVSCLVRGQWGYQTSYKMNQINRYCPQSKGRGLRNTFKEQLI